MTVARNGFCVPAVVLISFFIGNGANPYAAEPPLINSQQTLPPAVQLESSRRLTLKDFRSCVENKSGLILDARPQAVFEKGHVPGAFSLSLEDFDKQYARLSSRLESEKSKIIVVYCSSYFCESSGLVQKKLIGLGFTRVYLFPNGWAAWQKARLPEEK